MCISLGLPVHRRLQDGKELPGTPLGQPHGRIEVFLGYFCNMASDHNPSVAKFPGLALYSPHSCYRLIKE